jgi:hypothetical protein
MQKEIIDRDNPHKDIGKKKFRIRKSYTAWVEYDVVADSKDEAESAVMEHGGIDKIEWSQGYHNDEPVEVYSNDYNLDHSADTEIKKVAECVPYEDNSTIDFSDPMWSENELEWNEDYENPNKTESKSEEVPF